MNEVELYRKHRPRRLKDVLGQPAVVHLLQKLLAEGKLPHCLLLSGPSGTGKTTIARILKHKLGCHDRDYVEVNCAGVDSPMDTARDIMRVLPLAPMWEGKCRIWFLEEVQSLSRTTFAQQALLKMLEDIPAHVYFFLATTNPAKLLPEIRTRATELKLQALSADELRRVLDAIVVKEGKDIHGSVLQRIVDCSGGSARQALVYLHQVLALATTEEQLEAIVPDKVEKKAIDLCRTLLNLKSTWAEVATILKTIEEDPEQIRWAVLGYASSVLLNNGKANRASVILDVFESNFYDSKKFGLIRACYAVLGQR